MLSGLFQLLSGRQDSNLRQPGPKPGTLPTALRPEFAAAKVRIFCDPCKFFRNNFT